MIALENRARKFDQASTPKRLAQHLDAWERLSTEAEAQVARYDAFDALARQVDAQFALIDLASGDLRDPAAGAAALHRVGEQLQTWTGRIYQKLSSNLRNFAAGLFAYQPLLTQALAPVVAQWGAPAIQALACLWQCEADDKRHPGSLPERHARQVQWAASLDAAVALLGPEPLWAAWQALCAVLGRSWGSMLAECANSLLRPILAGRKHTDQGCLELVRFLHNVRPFRRGKRAAHSPAQLVGLEVPDDPLTLLGLAPKVPI